MTAPAHTYRLLVETMAASFIAIVIFSAILFPTGNLWLALGVGVGLPGLIYGYRVYKKYCQF